MVLGTFSEGFRMTVFPMVRAMGMVQKGTIRGKLKGTMAPTTPRGVRCSSQLMPMC